jgi:hypothetical protein
MRTNRIEERIDVDSHQFRCSSVSREFELLDGFFDATAGGERFREIEGRRLELLQPFEHGRGTSDVTGSV